MSKAEPLKHIERWAPAWATTKPITECGNPPGLEATSMAEYVTYRDGECRGSNTRAMGQYCVTCVETATGYQPPWAQERPGVDRLVRYLSQSQRGRHGPSPQVEAEIEAIALLLDLHREEFISTVDSLLSVTRLSDVSRSGQKRRKQLRGGGL